MTVESVGFPQLTIECGGELTEGECQDWAEQMLSSGRIESTRLVVTYRTGNSRRAADYFAATGRLLVTAAARSPGSQTYR